MLTSTHARTKYAAKVNGFQMFGSLWSLASTGTGERTKEIAEEPKEAWTVPAWPGERSLGQSQSTQGKLSR